MATGERSSTPRSTSGETARRVAERRIHGAERDQVRRKPSRQVHADCTGEYASEQGETERFVVLRNGADVRSVFWEGFGTGITTWRRIARASEGAPHCGQQTLRGTHTMRCQGWDLTGNTAIATSNALFVLTLRDGTLAGTFNGKVFGFPDRLTEAGVSGTYTVNDDCTVDTAFEFDGRPGLMIKARGVTFDQGAEAYGVPLGVYDSDGELVAPMAPLVCQQTRLGQ